MFSSVPYLGNGWTDCAEIWCVVRYQLGMRFSLLGGGVHRQVRTGCICMCAPLFRIYLGNDKTDCAEIWCVLRDQLTVQLTGAWNGVYLHVRTRVPLFRISGTVGLTALKFGML